MIVLRGRLVLCAMGLALGAASAVSAQDEPGLGDPRAYGAYVPPDGEAPGAPGEEEEEAEEDIVRYPVALAARPLVLPHGVGRLETGVYGGGRRGSSGPLFFFPHGLALGVIDELEIGVRWPAPFDPTLYGLGMVLHDPVIDVGVGGSITPPITTRGDTLARVIGAARVRPIEWMRIDTGLEIELLFTAQISPLVVVPLAVTVNPHRGFFVGAQGSIGWLDGSRALGDVGGVIGFTAYSATGALLDVRATVQGFFPAQTLGVSLVAQFYPRFWS